MRAVSGAHTDATARNVRGAPDWHHCGMSAEPAHRKKSIHPLRDALLAGLITFVTSAVGLTIVYVEARNAQLDAVRVELLQIARTTAAQVDGDLHRTLVSPAQEGSPGHLRALVPLVRTQRATTDLINVYTGIQRGGRVFWVLDSNRGLGAASASEEVDPIMTEYQEHDPELVRAFAGHIAIANAEPVPEKEHTFLSAFAPFYDSKGGFAGILGVDMVLDALDARMASIRTAFYSALGAVLLLSIGAGVVALRLQRFAASIVHELRDARAQAEKHAVAAESATHAKATFLASMSHEIRTPMNGMLGVADLLRTMSPSAAQAKLLDVLAASGASLLRIINDILDFSKIEAERLELRPRPFKMHGLVDELEHLLGAQARAKHVALIVELDAALPAAVDGDRQRLSQVLLNLGTNAVKFTDRGTVTIGIRSAASAPGKVRVEFSVRDTGIGMDGEAQALLFTPFTQLAESRRHRGGGTGLGLVIAQKLVNLMNGVISVHSEPGKGSRFSFLIDLPIAETAGETTTMTALRVDCLSVLVAEDNQVNQTIISAMLRQLGHIPTLVATGRAALDALARENFDLVLMDLNMPEMDGLEATRLLRVGTSGARNPRITVIALTANVMDGDRDACLAAGMDGFLSKPVTIATLRKAVEAMRATQRAA